VASNREFKSYFQAYTATKVLGTGLDNAHAKFKRAITMQIQLASPLQTLVRIERTSGEVHDEFSELSDDRTSSRFRLNAHGVAAQNGLSRRFHSFDR
jgi:phage-related minor tail protein